MGFMIVGTMIITAVVFYSIKWFTDDSKLGRLVGVIVSIIVFFGYLYLMSWADENYDNAFADIVMVTPYLLLAVALIVLAVAKIAEYVSGGKNNTEPHKTIVTGGKKNNTEPHETIVSMDWHSLIIANLNEPDITTDINTFDKTSTIYFHFTLVGRKHKTIKAKFVTISPNGSAANGIFKQTMISGSKNCVYWHYNDPQAAQPGNLTFYLYNKKNNQLIGTHTVVLI
jgi:hypothetical protein